MFGRQLRHAVTLENPLEVRTMRSGRRCRKSLRFVLRLHFPSSDHLSSDPLASRYSYPLPSFLTSSTPLFTDVGPPNILYYLPLELQALLNIDLPSRLSNIYESVTASFKGGMSFICPTAMKRGRPRSWVWQWREGRGKRMRGRRMQFEVVLQAYSCLR